jgi:hypothetical protein
MSILFTGYRQGHAVIEGGWLEDNKNCCHTKLNGGTSSALQTGSTRICT